jgi:sulfite exporter TauE/SafE
MQGLGLLAAFMTGMAGSLHCVGACTGIASGLLMLSTGAEDGRGSAALLHTGRLLAYSAAGVVVGVAGGFFAAVLALSGLNIGLRWVAAGVIIWTGLSIAGWLPSPRLADKWAIALRPRRLSNVSVWSRSPLLLGLGWGLMPCGMVYLALLNASLTGSPWWGGAYMAAFALGTMPALGSAAWGAARLVRRGHAVDGRMRHLLGLSIAAVAPLSLVADVPGLVAGLCRSG